MNMSDLIRLIDTLRGENGCPWDREQTPQSMILYLVEEVYELLDAIQSKKTAHIHEELGDVLFQLVFILILYEERGTFSADSVVQHTIKKMIHRHPHVFTQNSDPVPDIRKQWNTLKKNEKNHSQDTSVLDSVPPSTPALIRAYRVSKRAAATGFDWDDIDGVMEKMEEEWGEFKHALKTENKKATALELGDLFFTLINVARMVSIHPESSLLEAVHKFETRFREMERQASLTDRSLDSISKKEMNQLWDGVKKILD
jgi:tetrapyrrole methylase family protein/MazG family protein